MIGQSFYFSPEHSPHIPAQRMATQISVTGSYPTLPPKLDIHAGAKSHIFQPPRTPSASTSLHRSTAFFWSDHANGTASRKRARQKSYIPEQPEVSSYYDHDAWSPTASGLSSTLISPGVMSPVPLVNTQYKLAGGLDTPGAAFESAIEQDDVYATSPDLTLRWGRGWDRSSGSSLDGYFPQLSPVLGREANGRSRLQNSQSSRAGWGKAVYNVAGKVWDFCKMNAFRGFYAGGGQGYRMHTSPQLASSDPSNLEALKEKNNVFSMNGGITSLPGRFPEEDFIPDYMSQNHTSPPRPAKKIQREKGEGDLRASWVMVGNVQASRESSPTRISTRKMPPAGSPGRRPVSRAGRRPILPASRPSTSFAGSPGLRADRPASFASPRSPATSPMYESPVSVKVQRHAARIRRRELEDDAHLKRLNKQLKAMIKEGKEALGTKFEVEDEADGMIDEGYAEGDYSDERDKE